MKRRSRALPQEAFDPGLEAFPGHFGYRNRGRQTGLDYVDTQTEWGYAQGLFLKSLLTFKLRTRNLAVLLMMGIFVLGLWLPFEFGIAELLAGVPWKRAGIHYFFQLSGPVLPQLECSGILLVFALGGLLLLINIILSLKDILTSRRGPGSS